MTTARSLNEPAIRLALEEDAPWLAELLAHPTTAEYLAVSDRREEDLRTELAAASDRAGWLIATRERHPLAALKWSLVNRRSRIAELSHVVVEPDVRGQGIATAMTRAASQHLVARYDVHRVQLEVYGDNQPALRAFARAGFQREGTRRQAYWRRDTWQDGILYGLIADELKYGNSD